jgi:hypothetical protein
VKEEEPVLGPYTTREAALEVLEPFKDHLQHDGFLEFGVIFQHQGRTEEVFVDTVKYLKIWTNQPALVTALLLKHRIPEVIGLQFIDDYPRVTEAIPLDGQQSGWYVVMEALKERFESLPPAPEPRVPNEEL